MDRTNDFFKIKNRKWNQFHLERLKKSKNSFVRATSPAAIHIVNHPVAMILFTPRKRDIV